MEAGTQFRWNDDNRLMTFIDAVDMGPEADPKYRVRVKFKVPNYNCTSFYYVRKDWESGVVVEESDSPAI